MQSVGNSGRGKYSYIPVDSAFIHITFEMYHDKTHSMAFASSEDSPLVS